jgi:hypothetical protein
MQRQTWIGTARSIVVVGCLVMVSLMALTRTADARARGAHRGAEFAGGHRHGNNSYIKAASEDRDRLLNTGLKSICRGC